MFDRWKVHPYNLTVVRQLVDKNCQASHPSPPGALIA